MAESPHYKELLQLLNEFEIRYLIVGGYAVMKYTEPRFTKDLDVWVENSVDNAIRVFEALKKFGAPLEADNITTNTFQRQGLTYQIGIAPVRIDILTQKRALSSAMHGRSESAAQSSVLPFTLSHCKS